MSRVRLLVIGMAAMLFVPASLAAVRESPVLAPSIDPIAPYRGLGTWVDMYDAGPWAHPRRVVRMMDARGVDTLFVETANYHKPRRTPMFRPAAMAKMVEEAHRRDMHVVAWYVPSFDRLERDFKRSMAALRFVTPSGERFDSFALDIEATVVRDIPTRNRRAIALSERLRERVGSDYALGAIVPEARALYWPDFPYKALARSYDAFLPMAYFSYRTSGYGGVYDFIEANIRAIRQETGRSRVPVHVIGGIAEDSTPREVKALVDAARAKGAVGTSLYDFPTTSASQWEKLQKVADPQP